MSSERNAPRRTPSGRWFEDYQVGQLFHSPARTVTEADIAAFAGLSGDYNPLHVDEEFARRTAFRGRVAHGLLIESMASGLAHATGIFDGTISALAEIGLRFQSPVRAGDTIRLELGVVAIDPSPGPKRGRIEFSTNVFNQADRLVLEGTWTVVFLRRRGAGAATAPATRAEESE